MASKINEPEASKLLLDIEGNERKLKQVLKSPQPDEREVKALRSVLLEGYERLIVIDYDSACKNQVEQSLWKVVFYKRIEELRRKHTKTATLLNDPEKKERATQAVAQISSNFARFLDKASSFYLSLLQKLLTACKIALPGYTEQRVDLTKGMLSFAAIEESNPRQRERKQRMIMSSERCLTFLGDLERYRSLYTQKDLARDWAAAESHYSTAALLTPHVGNPHNQLAVLSTYRGDDLESMFHYARAMLASQPFATARENLLLLLDKNKQKLEELLAAKPQANSRVGLEEQGRQRREELSLRFVRVHGILHTQRDLVHFSAEEGAALVQLVATLDADDLKDSTVLRMAVVCLFSAHDLAARAELASLSQTGEAPPVAVAHQLAVCLALKLLSRLAVSARGRAGHLQAVAVLCGWLQFSPHILSSPPDADGSGQAKRELQAAVSALVDLLNLERGRQGVTHSEAHSRAWRSAPLPEDRELAAFQPLAGALAGLEATAQEGGLVSIKVVEGAERLKEQRLLRVEALAQLLSGGTTPMVYVDSQSGSYSVESPGTSQLSVVGPHSQHRAGGQLGPSASSPEKATPPACAPPPARSAPPAPLPSLLESAPSRHIDGSLGLRNESNGAAPGVSVEGAVSIQDMVMQAAMGQTEGEEELAMGEADKKVDAEEESVAVEEREARMEVVHAEGPRLFAQGEEDDAKDAETFGEDCMAVAGGVHSDGFGALADQTAAFASKLSAGHHPAPGSLMTPTRHVDEDDEEAMDVTMEHLVNSTIMSPGKQARGGRQAEEEVFLVRAPPAAALPPPALALGGLPARSSDMALGLHGALGVGGSHSSPTLGQSHAAPGTSNVVGFGRGGLGGFGAGRTGYGSSAGAAQQSTDAYAAGGAPQMAATGSLLPPSAFGWAGGAESAGQIQGLSRGLHEDAHKTSRFVTRNPFV